MAVELPDDALRSAIAARRDWAVKSLSNMVRCGSELGNEMPAQEVAAGIFEEMGLVVSMEPVDPDKLKSKPGFSPVDWSYKGRQNVIGYHRVNDPQGKSLVLNGHIDVVSPEPTKLWKSNPFEPVVYMEDGVEWMRGRGAGDMKGGSMCYMWAMMALRDLGYTPASQVVCQSVIEEECTGNGALAACEAGHLGDACLIPEPFNQTILRRQVGVVWFQTRVLGKTTHVLGAGRGVNAIEKSWVLIQALRALEEKINQPEFIPDGYKGIEHPINLNVGIINGGDWASTVAGECVTRFRLGLFPGERLEELRKTVELTVAEAATADPWLKDFPPTVEWIGFQAEGYDFDIDSDFARTLAAAHRQQMQKDPEELIATCTTDARFFDLYYNTPATCYGPLAKNIHGVDEVVSIDSMQQTAEVIGRFIDRWCGLQKKG